MLNKCLKQIKLPFSLGTCAPIYRVYHIMDISSMDGYSSLPCKLREPTETITEFPMVSIP